MSDAPGTSCGHDESRNGTFGYSFSSAVLVTFLVYVTVDVAVCAPYMKAAATPATLGFILLSAALLSGGAAIVLRAAIAMRRHIPRSIMRAFAAAVVTWYPARWLASVVTSGAGISQSGWATVIRVALLVALVLSAAVAAGILPRAHGCLSRRLRLIVGATIVALGFAAIALTSFHATTYVRPYRGVLIVSALLVEIGVLFALSGRARTSSRRAHLVAPVVLVGIAMLAFGLSRIGGSQRAYASYTVFSHTVVAQKLQSMLLRISPVFHATSRVSLDATRLARNNAVPVTPLPRGKYRGNNVLFVTFDALRADVVARTLAGYPTAPNLQALAARGVSFENAISNYSHTSRSIFSILAASWNVTFPSETHVSTDPSDVRARTRLPRLLRGAGYESVAIMISGRWGEVFFDKHRFPEFDRHISAGQHCEQQVAEFRRYLLERDGSRPFWTWVHIFDTHTPQRSSRSDQLFGDSSIGRYAAAVHQGDRCLGELVAAVQSAKEWNRTILVVSADHGEALGEHRRTFQHSTCYWHDIHIPLVIRLPDGRGPVSIKYPIQHSDLVPTLANLLGIRVDEPEVDGDDLSGLLGTDGELTARDQTAASMAFSQGHAQQYVCASVVSGGWHLIYTEAAKTYELYNVDVDPIEERNLAAERPDIVERLRPVLDTFRERAAAARNR